MTTMTELGARLRQERESRGLSHEDVARRIKIASRTLVAIENGSKEELPHLVYTKGFVKTYATLLNLDPEELGRIVDLAYAEEAEEQDSADMVVKPPKAAKPRKKISWVPVVLLLVFACAAAGGYFAYSKGMFTGSDSQQAVEPATQPENVEKESHKQPVENTQVEQPEAVENREVVEQVESSVVEQPQPESSASVEKESEVEAEKPESENALATPPEVEPTIEIAPEPVVAQSTADPLTQENSSSVATQTVMLAASGDCWIEAWGDDFPRKELFLRANQKFPLSFPNNLTVRLGNSGVITVSLNGKPYSFEGKDGKVVTLEFPSAN